jgi:hypothetical protein
MRTKLLEPFNGLFVDPSDAAKNAALHLFLEIRESLGEQEARHIFGMWGTPPTADRIKEINNLGLLDLYDLMKPKPDVQRLARELAEENKKLPRQQQRGAGSTDPIALALQINRVRKERKAAIKRGTWRGPFPPKGQQG